MGKVIYRQSDGVEHAVELEPGVSVMIGAKSNGLPGIIGDCGGACACATCHVYVDEAWQARLEPKAEIEEFMLEMADDVQPNSRLSCQIKMSAELDGLVVHLPDSQI